MPAFRGEERSAQEKLGAIARPALQTGPDLQRRKTIEALVDTLRSEIEPALSSALPADGEIQYAGSVQDLERAIGIRCLRR